MIPFSHLPQTTYVYFSPAFRALPPLFLTLTLSPHFNRTTTYSHLRPKMEKSAFGPFSLPRMTKKRKTPMKNKKNSRLKVSE